MVKEITSVCKHPVVLLISMMMGILMFISNPDDARADGGWTLNWGANFLYQNVYISDWNGGANSHSKYDYYGGSINFQPEYRFFDGALGIGIDVALGGLSFRKDRKEVDEPGSELYNSDFEHGKHNDLYLMAFITAKGIIPLRVLELWGEVGFGIRLSDFKVAIPLEDRIRLGMTLNFGDNLLGVGIHLGCSGIGMLFVDLPSVQVGVHVVKRF